MKTRIPLISGLLLAMSSAGCGGPADFEVAGQVTLDGQPLAHATISFVPDDEALVGAVARTDAQGQYDAEVSIDRKGLAPGVYTVRITTFDEGEAEADPPIPPVAERVPSKYNYDSDLKVEVKPERNSFDFALDSKGRLD